MIYLMKLYNEKFYWDIYKFKKNLMNITSIKKIIINVGCGLYFNDKNSMNIIYKNIYSITNQLPVFVKCKKPVASFKTKKNDLISIMVTLRGKNMYNFLDKFLNLFLTKFKKFKKFNKSSLDFNYNFNFGISDYSNFLEVKELSDFNVGFNVNIVFNNSKSFSDSLILLKLFNFNIDG